MNAISGVGRSLDLFGHGAISALQERVEDMQTHKWKAAMFIAGLSALGIILAQLALYLLGMFTDGLVSLGVVTMLDAIFFLFIAFFVTDVLVFGFTLVMFFFLLAAGYLNYKERKNAATN